jgi:hypothetical protein
MIVARMLRAHRQMVKGEHHRGKRRHERRQRKGWDLLEHWREERLKADKRKLLPPNLRDGLTKTGGWPKAV